MFTTVPDLQQNPTSRTVLPGLMSAKVSSLVRSWAEYEQLDSCLVTFSSQNKCMMISVRAECCCSRGSFVPLCFMSPLLYMEEAAVASMACTFSKLGIMWATSVQAELGIVS